MDTHSSDLLRVDEPESLLGRVEVQSTDRLPVRIIEQHRARVLRQDDTIKRLNSLPSDQSSKKTQHRSVRLMALSARKEVRSWGLSRNRVKNYSKGPCVTFLE